MAQSDWISLVTVIGACAVLWLILTLIERGIKRRVYDFDDDNNDKETYIFDGTERFEE